MDSVEIAIVASPFANLSPIYEVDLDADVLLIVPPYRETPDQRETAHIQGINGPSRKHKAVHAAPPASRPGLRLKVSSKHLALASRVFRNRLQFACIDVTRQSDGRVYLRLTQEYDPKAVSIVMDAIHGRGSKVPKSVDVNTLAQIALFVDRFQLLDAVEVYAERWITRLEGSIPNAENRDLALWIYASHVFRHADIFEAVTKRAATQSAGPIQTFGFPIREKIIKHIDTNRQSLLAQALTLVHQTLDDLTSGAASCPTHHCDSLLLGELIKALHAHRLVWPRPEKPFLGISFVSVVDGVSQGLALLGARERGTENSELKVEVEPWYMKTANLNGVKEGPGQGWGVVDGAFPLTPAASPEPVYRNGRSGFEEYVHECEARRVVAKLENLGRLAEGVDGLVLEGKLGYLAY